MHRVQLHEIDARNRAEVEGLRVGPEQERFVDGVRESLAEAEAYTPTPWFRAIYADEVPVGFVMLADNDPTSPWPYYLWRLLIDARFQRRGYGAAALDRLVAYVRTRPGATALVTSVATYGDERDEGSPMTFYLAYGFTPTGELHEHETVISLSLSA